MDWDNFEIISVVPVLLTEEIHPCLYKNPADRRKDDIGPQIPEDTDWQYCHYEKSKA